jgi:hypothetical protein
VKIVGDRWAAIARLLAAATDYGDTIDTPASTPEPRDVAATLAALKTAAQAYALAARIEP